MRAEEIQGILSKGVGLGGPALQKRQGVFLKGLPSGLWPGRMRWHGEKIGDALSPVRRHAVGNLKKDGVTTGQADG